MKKKIRTEDSSLFWNTAHMFIDHYLLDVRRVSTHTRLAYRTGLNAYIDFLDTEKGVARRDINFGNFEAAALKEYQDWGLNTRKWSPKTSNLRLTAVRSFLEYAAGEYPELMFLYVAARDIKDVLIPARKIEYFEKDQMGAILRAPDARTSTGRRNQMILILMYDSAMRVSELTELRVGSLHLNAEIPYVTVHGKGDKFRNVPLMEKTCQHLTRYLELFHDGSPGDAPLFYAVTHGRCHPLSSDTMENLIRSCADRARKSGVQMPDSCHCHMIRKTRAMDLYKSGVPLAHIQQLLGHENISTTSGFYAFATLDTLAKSMAKAGNEEENQMQKRWKDSKVIERLYRL